MAKENKSSKLFFLKIDLPALTAAVLFVVLIFFYLIPGFEKAMMDGKRKMIHEMTASAYSLVQHYHSLVSSGEMSLGESQEKAAEAIAQLRYGESLLDYFWITDLYPRMIIHPYRPDLNGQDLTNFHDSRGKQIFVDFVNAVTPAGESYVEYMWQWNDDSTRIVPKLSYVRLYKPWGWVIGTGIYIEDVRQEIRRIERRALITSGIIGSLLVLLLSIISRQSHRIEIGRKQANEELVKSKELYKTLSEASSEGIIIWTDDGLRANKTLLALLNYNEKEFAGKSIRSVVNSPAIPETANASEFYNELDTGIQSECILKTSEGRPVRSYISFSRLETGGVKAVLTVLRPVKSYTPRIEFSAGTGLLDNVSTGFFRITFGSRNRFIYISKSACEILGYHDANTVLNKNIDQFFVNTDELKLFKRRLAAREIIRGDTVILKRKEGDETAVILNAEVVEAFSGEIWCEGTLEHLSSVPSGEETAVTDIFSAAAAYILEGPVSNIQKPPLLCRADTTLEMALRLMEEKGYSAIIVSDDRGRPVGTVVPENAAFYLAGGGERTVKISDIMSSPPDIICGSTSVHKAARVLEENGSQCLIVTDGEGNLTGMITTREISGIMSVRPSFINDEISAAGSSGELLSCHRKGRDIAVRMIGSGADPTVVSLFLSEVGDRICSRVIEICSVRAGAPPCRYAFIQTGSAGRREQSLLTDQDNAIIFEDIDEAAEDSAREYFVKLGAEINTMLDNSGYRSCKGNNMAGNPVWCQPLRKWKRYFSGWINAPGPEELLGVSIFFDFRFTAGDRKLSDDLREHVRFGLRTNDIFFHHLTNAWKVFQPSVAALSSESVDTKRLIMPLTGIVRLYALKHGIEALSTTDRLRVLYNGGHVSYRMLVALTRAWKTLSGIRMKGQAAEILEGKDPDNKADLRMQPEMRILAEEAVHETNNLMQKAYNDFHASAG